MSQRVSTLVAATEEATRELPMPVIAYFIIAFAVFVLLLGVTWSFRNTAAKLQAPRAAHRAQALPATAPRTTRTTPTGHRP